VIDETKILHSIKTGEHSKVLSYLYETTLRKVRQYILKNNGSKDDANDIFQDAVVILFTQVRADKFNPSYSIDAFIYSVARNLWIDKSRRDKRFTNYDSTQQIDYISDDNSHLDNLIETEKTNAMSLVFNQLDEKCKKILSYVIYEKLSMREIKDKMGYTSEDVAKTNHYRCKQYLSKIVKSSPELVKLLRH